MTPLCFSLADLLGIIEHHRQTATIWDDAATRAETNGALDDAAECRATAVLWSNAADDLARLLSVNGERVR